MSPVDETLVSEPQPNKKMKDIFTHVYELNNEMQENIYTNQIGRFPIKSIRGNQYLMVMIDIDSSYISMEPMKNHSLSEMIKTYQAQINRLKQTGI